MFAWKRIRWFVVGFTVVFVGLTVFRQGYHFTGNAVISMPLWRYYWLELPRVFSPNVPVGSGDGSAALSMLLQHVFVSLAGGAAVHFLAARRKSTDRPAKSSQY